MSISGRGALAFTAFFFAFSLAADASISIAPIRRVEEPLLRRLDQEVGP
jgi:hypothetical protein